MVENKTKDSELHASKNSLKSAYSYFLLCANLIYYRLF